MSSAGLAVARRVLASTGVAAPLRQTARLVPRGLMLRYAMPSVRMISISASLRMPAAKATKAKKTTATKKKPAATKKKPAAKKKVTKAKAKPKAKKVVKKKVPAKKPKKTLTPEEKEKAELRRLKKMSLLNKVPTLLPRSAWNIYMVKNIAGTEGNVTEKVGPLAAEFKNLPESEKQQLAEKARANHVINQETIKKWIESYPVEAIYIANLARRRLAKKNEKSRVFVLHDERLPNRAQTAYNLFIKDRYSQTEADSSKDIFRIVSEQWKTLSAEEKAPFEKEAASQAKKSGEVLKLLKQKGSAFWKEELAKQAEK